MNDPTNKQGHPFQMAIFVWMKGSLKNLYQQEANCALKNGDNLITPRTQRTSLTGPDIRYLGFYEYPTALQNLEGERHQPREDRQRAIREKS